MKKLEKIQFNGEVGELEGNSSFILKVDDDRFSSSFNRGNKHKFVLNRFLSYLGKGRKVRITIQEID